MEGEGDAVGGLVVVFGWFGFYLVTFSSFFLLVCGACLVSCVFLCGSCLIFSVFSCVIDSRLCLCTVFCGFVLVGSAATPYGVTLSYCLVPVALAYGSF